MNYLGILDLSLVCAMGTYCYHFYMWNREVGYQPNHH